MTIRICDFVLLSAAWQWIGNTRVSEILTDFRDYKGHVWNRFFQSVIHHPAKKRSVQGIFTLSVCKKKFRPGTSLSWFHFLVNDVNPVFGNRSKNHQKSFPTINIFWESTLKNSSKSWKFIYAPFCSRKINSKYPEFILFCCFATLGWISTIK